MSKQSHLILRAVSVFLLVLVAIAPRRGSEAKERTRSLAVVATSQ